LLKAEQCVICGTLETLVLQVSIERRNLPISVPLRSRMNAP
jgi:hypothetical protein